MNTTTILSALTLVLSTACAATPVGEPPAENGGVTSSTATTGQGGTSSTTAGAGGRGAGGQGGAGGQAATYATAIGASYPNGGDGRIVLIDATGTRSALHNPAAGTFESADDIDELEGGLPFPSLVAAARLADETYFFDAAGNVSVYDHAQATFGPVQPLADAIDDAPFTNVGAAFGLDGRLFVFNAGGTSYAAYDTNNDSWSPIYSFLLDFGGGGAPIASVGAAYAQDDGAIVLFDHAGTSYCVYAGNGEFSNDYDIEELGDGTLTFNDVDDD